MSFVVFPCLCLYDSTGPRIPLTVHPKLARRSWVVTSSGCWWPPKSFVLGLGCQEGRNRQNIMMGLDDLMVNDADIPWNLDLTMLQTLTMPTPQPSGQGKKPSQPREPTQLRVSMTWNRHLDALTEIYGYFWKSITDCVEINKDMMSRQMHSDVLILPLVGLRIESLATGILCLWNLALELLDPMFISYSCVLKFICTCNLQEAGKKQQTDWCSLIFPVPCKQNRHLWCFW